MSKTKRVVIIGAILMGAGASLWAASYLRGDPQLAKVREMQQELRVGWTRDTPPEERREQFRDFREAMEQLTPQQRSQLREEGGERYMQQAQKRMEDFFALSADERTASLDEQIDRMEEMRERMQERMQNRQRDGEGRRGRSRGDWASRRGRFNSDPNARNERSRRRLDSTSPEFRAMRDEYRRLMNERRQERGLPKIEGRRRGGFGGPRRFGGSGIRLGAATA